MASDRDISSDEDGDSSSDRSSSITTTTPRNSQLRLTFNKAKQHLSFDKWRNSGSVTSNNNHSLSSSNSSHDNNSLSPGNATNMPSASNDSPVEPFSRLSRWFSIRRGSTHQYDVDKQRDHRASSVESEVDSPMNAAPATTPNRMPQLNETDEESQTFALSLLNGARTNGTGPINAGSATLRNAVRQLAPSLPPAPPGLTQQQLKRRHIIAAIVHSENSYVATLQRLVNVSC